MAERIKTKRHEAVALFGDEAYTLSSDGVAIDFDGVDENTLLIFQTAGNVTFVKGDHIQGVTDLTVTVPAYGAIAVPSMEFKMTQGENKGCIVVKGSGKVAVVEIDQL